MSSSGGPSTATTPNAPSALKGFNKPPLSQPLLEGGAEGGQMAAIQEEREASSGG